MLHHLLENDKAVSFEIVEHMVKKDQQLPPISDVTVKPVDLSDYDVLFFKTEAVQ